MKYKCIIFDCDGVLVDSESIFNEVLLRMVKPMGVNIDPDFALTFFRGKDLKTVFKYVESLMDKPLPANFEQSFRAESFRAFERDIKPVEGIREVIQQLSIPFCVASSGPQEKIKINLKATGF